MLLSAKASKGTRNWREPACQNIFCQKTYGASLERAHVIMILCGCQTNGVSSGHVVNNICDGALNLAARCQKLRGIRKLERARLPTDTHPVDAKPYSKHAYVMITL